MSALPAKRMQDGDVKEEQASPLKSENASADALMVKTEPDLAALVAEAEAINVDDFKVKALSCTSRILKLFGGPRQYLDHVFSTEAAQLEFAEFINEKFPQKYELTYSSAETLPSDLGAQFVLRPSALAWGSQSSTKPAPYCHAAIDLVDEILAKGFQTAGDHLILWAGVSNQGAAKPVHFWTSYVKGACRASCCLFVLALAKEANWALEVLHPVLYNSLCSIYCRWDMETVMDVQQVAFRNAQLSLAGDLRKAHDVPTWLSKLRLLAGKGLQPEEAIRKWNSTAAQRSQLQGAKRTCLLNLLQCPNEACEILLAHAGRYGKDSAFSEECFSQKQLLPGFVPRLADKKWSGRLTVSNTSFVLMLRYIDFQHSEKLREMRFKLSKDSMAEAAQLAAMACSVTSELKQQFGIDSSILQDGFLEDDRHFVSELQLAIGEKSSKFEIGSLTIVKSILKQHQVDVDKRGDGSSRNIKAAELENEEFDLMMKTWQLLGNFSFRFQVNLRCVIMYLQLVHDFC